ncbi:MAG: hypothetical protein DIU75_010290 [Mycolicibacterium hassiacum]|jgi:hypothetical protein|uniref:hypothetical protein n=1 Tax=Mycolicibacterium hassiacum TaxID=46351 RepID=UPI0023F67DCE|nr:hypothetical protein [Mycolicibacterium hassiacum]MBX5488473.1 hypothetical protein [Mycolicibacterium hassiacum]
MSATELLAQAQRILSTPDTGGHSPRMAAFLARRAVEDVIERRCADLVGPITPATWRSKLLILRVLDDPAVADRAAYAWNRLSNACHLHAFEMQPSVTEVQHLCRLVAELMR